MRRAAGIVLAAMVFALPALAAESSEPVHRANSPALQRCLESDDGASTLGQMRCIEAELKIQDGRLNTAYRAAQVDLNARQKAKLLAAQRSWIAFRDADCAAWYDEDWGTIAKVLASDCLLTRTIERTDQLKDFTASH